MDKYLKMFEAPMKKWLAEHYSPEKVKARWERTVALDKKWIREEGDLGGKKNPMANNMLEAYAFFAFYDSVDRSFSKEDERALEVQLRHGTKRRMSRYERTGVWNAKFHKNRPDSRQHDVLKTIRACEPLAGKGFLDDEHKCKDAEYIQRIEKAMLSADLLLFTSPAYVFHATDAMKAMLDHFGYRWMPHRPAKELFGKRAVIIIQCLGAGSKSAAKDIKDSLSWWGISDIKVLNFRLFGDINWEKLSEKKKKKMTEKNDGIAAKVKSTDLTKPSRTRLSTRFKFYMVRMMQTGLGKADPEYTDFKDCDKGASPCHFLRELIL